MLVIVLILCGEILSRSLMGGKELNLVNPIPKEFLFVCVEF